MDTANKSVIDKNWLAAYLYYAEPWEKFLIDGVRPFIRQIMDSGDAKRFFFIRYWEKGPHIRLRFNGDPGTMDARIKPRLIEYFENYFQKNPSERKDPDYLKQKDYPKDQQWFPNNTVQFIPYEPEIERYGGPAGIGIAEQQFQYSTNAVLAVMGESDGWDYDRALGAAIQLHLGFAYAMEMDIHEAAAFFDSIFNMWFYRSYTTYNQDLPEEELKKRRDETMKAFHTNFDKQKDALVPFHDTVWEAFTEGVEFEQEWLNQWLADNHEILEKLTESQEAGTLEIAKWWPKQPDRITGIVPGANYQRWAILESYVHMTNNRLGILNRDEAYLGFLIKESLKSIERSKK